MTIEHAYDKYQALVGGIFRDRSRDSVYKRQAFINAFRDRASNTHLGRVVGKHHATVIHAKKNHESSMLYPEYQDLYNLATDIATEVAGEPTEMQTLKNNIEDLRTQVAELYTYKEKYYKLHAKLCTLTSHPAMDS